MDPKSIVVVGSCMVDFVSYASRLPKAGETIHGSKFVTNFGGKGANQCVAAAKLGGKTTLIARVGLDSHGENYLENLRSLGVNATNVMKTDGQSTGIAQINVSDAGENQIVIVSGANNSLSSQDVEKCRDVVENAGILVCQLETKMEVAITALKLSKGISILNGAPSFKEFPAELLTLPTIFCVNESEAEDFAGIPIKTLDDGKQALKKLLQLGCKSVILTMGAEGVLFGVQPSQIDIFHTPCPQVTCVDSTGAGDMFIGALAFLLANWDRNNIENCIKVACQLASDSVTRPGTQISYPHADILKDLNIFIK
ncbi:ribokinase-like [Atheta coriaria]|uniref:ribokinase-like n=1 Tax=Dalotia coriaria TaxID=877792 RepID=UPI0031F411FE